MYLMFNIVLEIPYKGTTFFCEMQVKSGKYAER